MGTSIDELSATYPRLYHITHAGGWSGIQEHGLLSTEALVDLFGIDGTLRNELLSARRPDCVPIQHPDFGHAVIRDQKPLIESRLRTALQDGLTPRDWYALLNRKTFFWVSEERFEGYELQALMRHFDRHSLLLIAPNSSHAMLTK